MVKSFFVGTLLSISILFERKLIQGFFIDDILIFYGIFLWISGNLQLRNLGLLYSIQCGFSIFQKIQDIGSLKTAFSSRTMDTEVSKKCWCLLDKI